MFVRSVDLVEACVAAACLPEMPVAGCGRAHVETECLDELSKQCVQVRSLPVTTRVVPDALADKLTAGAAAFALSFEDVGMGDIAKASGIPRATLYYYFAGKDDVLAFLLQSMLDDLRISVATALEADGGTRDRLMSVVRAQLAHLGANPAASQLLLMNLGRAGRLGAIASGVNEGFHAPVRKILNDGVRDGALLDIDVEVAATAIYGAVTIVGLQALLVAGKIDVDAVAESLFPVFWHGIVRPVPNRTRRAQR